MLGHANTVEQVKGVVQKCVARFFFLSCDILTERVEQANQQLLSSSLANRGDSDEQINTVMHGQIPCLLGRFDQPAVCIMI